MLSTQHMPGWKQLIKILAQLKKNDDIEKFLQLFLTKEEQDQLAGRLLLTKGLLEGKLTQRELAKELNVSIAKITRGSNALKQISQEDIKSLAYLLDVT